MTEDLLYFNGINGSSGDYLLPPLTAEQVSKIAQGEELDPEELDELIRKDKHVKGVEPDFAPIEGVDPKNIAETGWGVIFAYNADPAIREALSELLDHRKKEATQHHEHYYQEYSGPRGYRFDKEKNRYETKNQFLSRQGVGPGPADPDKMPYYLLIVGDPVTIPYRFQSQLSVQYAVGRIYFDTPQEYAQYARSVVQAETGNLSLSPNATFFGVCNPGDAATNLSTQDLIQPLSQWVVEEHSNWDVKTILKEQATKARLKQVLGGSETPSLLFTASHGMGFNKGDEKQLRHQGALLCQDWPGRQWGRKPIPEDFYFSGDDVGEDARLLGLIAFFFACYGAGTPQKDEFDGNSKFLSERPEIAPYPFMARLPQKLLSHPKGGALAVVGHVDRAWGCSFSWSDIRGSSAERRQIAVFQSAVKRLLEGHPVGSAIEYFDERYAEISSDLSVELEEIKFGATPNNQSLAGMWTANNDARNYAIIGDPAVRLMVASSKNASSSRPTTEPVHLPSDKGQSQGVAGEADFKKAQSDLIAALDKFVKTAPQAAAGDTLSLATNLLNALKTK
jgi:Peptidase family C25